MSNSEKIGTYWMLAGQPGPYTTHPGTVFVRSSEYQKTIKFDEVVTTPNMWEIMANAELDPDYLAYTAVKYAARRMLPYGRWTTGDNRIIIFNREYQPIFERIGEVNHFIKHGEIIENISKVEYFYDDSNSPISYLVRKFKDRGIDKVHAARCKKSLLICLTIINEFEPQPSSKQHVTTWRSLVR
jgi:hypothetical protein